MCGLRQGLCEVECWLLRVVRVHVSAEVYRRLTVWSLTPRQCCGVAGEWCGVDGGVDQEKQHSFRQPRFLEVSSVYSSALRPAWLFRGSLAPSRVLPPIFLCLEKDRLEDPPRLSVGILRASRAARMAWSKTSFRLRCVRAEDSTYPTAPIWCARRRAATSVTGCSRYCASSMRTCKQ